MKRIFGIGIVFVAVAAGFIIAADPPVPAINYAQADLLDEWYCIRNASTNDTATSVTAAALAALVPGGEISTNAMFPVRGAKNVALRFVGADSSDGNAENATVTATVVGYSQGRSSANALAAAKGTVLYIGAITLGSDVTTNADPMGFDANTGGWYECDTVVETKDAGGYSLTSNSCYDCAGDNRQATLVIDPRGNKFLYVYLTARSGLTNARVYARRIGG